LPRGDAPSPNGHQILTPVGYETSHYCMLLSVTGHRVLHSN
jgi:hypothetical protein